MEISVEISYYPLDNQYDKMVTEFLEALSEYKKCEIKIGLMSTLIIGDYDNIMDMLKITLKPFLENYPSVFKISIASACKSCQVDQI